MRSEGVKLTLKLNLIVRFILYFRAAFLVDVAATVTQFRATNLHQEATVTKSEIGEDVRGWNGDDDVRLSP